MSSLKITPTLTTRQMRRYDPWARITPPAEDEAVEA